MNHPARTICGLLGVLLGVAAISEGCSPAAKDPPKNTSTQASSSSGGQGGAGGAASGSSSSGMAGGFNPTTGSGGAGGQATNCDGNTPSDDHDKDGYTEQDNPPDCNDCDPSVSPGAVEVIAEPDSMGNLPTPVDEDCDGNIDNLDPPCDDSIALNTEDPVEAAKAIGLCKFVVGAQWTLADGTLPPLDPVKAANFHKGHAVLPDYGPANMPQEGKSILVLSSGTARKEGDAEFVYRNFDKNYVSNAPFGFPKESPACPGVTTKTPHDATGLEVEIKAPTNAQAVKFDFHFFTWEWPQYICTNFNDFFVAIMEPFPPNQFDGNISFDSGGNPISVNAAFLESCGCPGGPPCLAPPGNPNAVSYTCTLGAALLQGTPFDQDTIAGWSNGSTGWLRTTAPVTPGKTFKIRFVTYDSSDGNVDSLTLIDNWQWSAKPGTVVTEPPK